MYFFFSEAAGRPKCPLDPYFIIPDKCKCVDFQVLKLQELPDFIPQVYLIVFCLFYHITNSILLFIII